MLGVVAFATALLALLALSAADVAGQDLHARIMGAGSDAVSFRYATHEDVKHCDGAWNRRRGSEWNSGECWNGPAEVRVQLRNGQIHDLDVEIVRDGSEPAGETADLGTVAPDVATAFFFGVARTEGASVAEDAVGAAAMADQVVIWPELLDLARDGGLESKVRQSATFWLGQASASEALAGLKALVEDDPDLDVRESAVFALTQQKDEEAIPVLLEIADGDNHPDVRQAAFFWLSQYDDPRVLAFFERVLSSGDRPRP